MGAEDKHLRVSLYFNNKWAEDVVHIGIYDCTHQDSEQFFCCFYQEMRDAYR